MTRQELTARMADAAEISRPAADRALKAFAHELIAELSRGEKFNITGFGTFEAVTRRAHTGRNPMTGEAIQIPESTNVHFRPSKALKDALNKA